MTALILTAIAAALALLVVASLPATAIGLLVCWHIARPQKAPADTSNRMNKVRLFWFALTREDLLVPTFEWLRRDELDNVTPHPGSEGDR